MGCYTRMGRFVARFICKQRDKSVIIVITLLLFSRLNTRHNPGRKMQNAGRSFTLHWLQTNVHWSVFCGARSHKSGSSLGSTGRMRFPKEESWVMKKPDEWTWACCRAAFCWAAMCCCSALSLASFRLGLDDSGMLAPGLFRDWLCSSRLFSLSSSARMATRVLFWKPGAGGFAAMSS